MSALNVIKASVGRNRYTITAPLVKEDYGIVLQIEGINLPEVYQVDFSNSEFFGRSVTMIGNADGVLIPQQFIKSGKDVFAFYYHVGNNFGRTLYKFRIPNRIRPERTNETPEPEEQSVIDQTISALNTAVETTTENAESAKSDADRAEEARTLAETARGIAVTSATNALNSANTAIQSKDVAVQKAGEARVSADEAEVSAQRAEQAMNTAGYIHMEIREDGHLWMQKTDGVDVDFYLGDDGHLYLTTE